MAKKKTSRDEDISRRPMIKKALLDVYKDVEKGFDDQRERADQILDHWDAYNCILSPKQFYSGDARLFMPYVHDAVEARQTRFVNQLFPQAGRFVEVITNEEEHPQATMALLEFYVMKAKLRTEVVPALFRCGDTEGQYSLYVDWQTLKRYTAHKAKEPVTSAGIELPEAGEVETVVEEVITTGHPSVELIADADLLVLPQVAKNIDDALERGGSVTVIRRWSKREIKKRIKDGDIDRGEGESLLKEMDNPQRQGQKDPAKEIADAAGIKIGAGNKHALVYETWTKLQVGGELRICRSYLGGATRVLGCKINPYWCDKVPIISASVEKQRGVFKGKAPVSYVLDMQILANDTINEAADSAHFSAMPIVATDPEKNPRFDTMVMGPAAIWLTSPETTKFMEFPELWRSGLERAEAIKTQIFQTLGVNPSMIPQSTALKTRKNQAEIANEQQVDILTTADAVIGLEESVLSPLLQWFADLDHQFRDDALDVPVFGEMGQELKVERVEPLQQETRYLFRWLGVEAARNAARLQQQIAFLNVVTKIPPQKYQGFQLNLAPVLVSMTETQFGPRLARLVLKDMRKQLTMDPLLENQILADGMMAHVHPGDNDIEHIQVHMAEMQAHGDPHMTIRAHIQEHQQQLQQKAMAAQGMMQQGPGGGAPQGAGPAPGAQPGSMRGMKGPPGMIPADSMPAAGATPMPRIKAR